jgi:hypothetical protein
MSDAANDAFTYLTSWETAPTKEELRELGIQPNEFRFSEVSWSYVVSAMLNRDMLDDPYDLPYDPMELRNLARGWLLPKLFGVPSDARLFDEFDNWIEYEYPIDTPEGRFQRAVMPLDNGDLGGAIPVYKFAGYPDLLIVPEEIGRALTAVSSRSPS